MCWISKVNKTFIASTNIHVFKIARIKKSDNKVRPYFQDVSGIVYKENTTYTCGKDGFYIKLAGVNMYVVYKAMHSYSIENIRLFHSEDVLLYAGTYKTTQQSQDAIAHPQYYKADYAVIMLCTIPKGTRYAVNTMGEIVSDKIHVEKIITNPFTFNKDWSLSKRSVEKINKILNNWENENRKF